MVASSTVQLRVPDDLLARIDGACGEVTRTAWLLGLAERELDDAGPDYRDPVAAPSLPVTNQIPPGGIDSPGVACAWPTCWARDTARYGVTNAAELTRTDYAVQPRDEEACGLVLCPAHAARLNGFRYVRPTVAPRAAAKVPQTA